MNNKNSITITAVVVLALIAAGVFYFWSRQTPPAPAEPAAPIYGTDNPLEKKPDLSPTAKTNPYANVKTNPFE